MIKIAIFASGGGSNAKKIIEHFRNHSGIGVGLIVTNNKSAGVISIAEKNNIPVMVIERSHLSDLDIFLQKLQDFTIKYVILAGFLLLIPKRLIDSFPGRILNIHPSLLPKYGGKGMYGHHVHEKVKSCGEKETGMTVHLVNEKFDDGKILFQEKCNITPEMTSEEIASEVLKLEHKNYSRTIEEYIIKHGL
ncbi:MAG: phosphoribosylglycinamide formyltransferase [Saprospiraceae bacterium]|nr:phosphoribosylglycinamide formyltransferase [Saprospiraceae bacterium]MBP6446615.1 phosphoribosylglycinamide formyltransferase [Saprospiraceae bacterium]